MLVYVRLSMHEFTKWRSVCSVYKFDFDILNLINLKWNYNIRTSPGSIWQQIVHDSCYEERHMLTRNDKYIASSGFQLNNKFNWRWLYD